MRPSVALTAITLTCALLAAGCISIEPKPSVPVIAVGPYHATFDAAATGTWDDAFEQLDWDTTSWLAGEMPPVWELPALDRDVRLTTFQLNATFDVRQAMLGDDAVRPSWTAWLGHGVEWTDHLFVASPRIVEPGLHQVTFTARLPGESLYIPAGTPLKVGIASYHVRAPGALAVEPGNTTLTLMGEQAPATYYDETRTETFDGTVQGGRCVAPLDAGGARQAHRVPLGTAIDGARIELVRTEGTGGTDIDFIIRNAEGETIAGSHGPQTPEGATIWAPQWQSSDGDDSDYVDVLVFACHPQAASYTVTATWLLQSA